MDTSRLIRKVDGEGPSSLSIDRFIPWRERNAANNAASFMRHYGCAVASIALAVYVRHLLALLIGVQQPYTTIYFAVMLTAWYGGVGPALVSVALGALAADYFLIPHQGVFGFADAQQEVGMALHLGTNLGIALIGGVMHTARGRARASQLWAEASAKELLESNKALHDSEEQLRLLNASLDRLVDERTRDLRTSQAMLTTAESVARIGSWDWDMLSNNLIWSEEHYRLFGYAPSASNATYENWLARVHPDDKHRVQEAVDAAMAGQKPYDIDYRIILPDGSERIANSKGKVFYDASGKPVRMVGTVHDITERKRAEDEVRQNRELLLSIIDSSPDWIFVKDLHHRFALVNRAFAGSQNLQPSEMIGRLDTEFWSIELSEGDPAKGSRGFHDDDRDAFRGEFIHNSNDLATFADGATHILDTYKIPLRDSQGRVYGVLCYSRDVTDRQRMEAALRASQTMLATAENIAGVGSWNWNIATNELIWSDEMCRMFGYTPGRFTDIYEGWMVCVHPDDQKRVQEAIDAAVAGLRPYDIEYPIIARDGARRIIHAKGEIFRDADGKPVRMVGMCHDMTERKRAEAEMRESRQRLELALQGGGLGIWDWYPQTGAVVYSDLWAQMLEYRLDEVEPHVDFFKQHVHPADLPGTLDRLTRHIEGRLPMYQSEHRLRTKSGSWIWVLDRGRVAEMDKDGRVVRVTGVISDITERKRAEEQLRKLSLAVEQSSNIIIITNTEGVIEYVNSKFTEVTGYSAEEAIGRSPAVFNSRLTSDQKYAEFWAALTAEGEWRGEFLNRKKDGELFWCEEHIAPIHDSSGKITHFVAVETDVTDRRKTAEQLEQAQKMETAGHLAGGIAHDFNNLLTIIQGNLELLHERLAGQGEACGLADRALHAAARSAELVNQLLLFSRQQFLQPRAVDVHALIERMKGLLSSMITETITVSISAPDDLWHAFVDPAQLENALLNLALNARDAMPQGGTLSIEAENVELILDRLPAGSNIVPGSFVHIRVADTGTGMLPEVLQRAFEPFFTTKEVGKGSGLGLSMVYGFIKQSGGHIEIDSAPDRGTRVDLYLKRTEPERVAEAPEGEAHALAGEETILVVEDNPDVREIAVRLLNKLGYRIIEARNGPAALAILESSQAIDLLFTDIVMPGAMSGAELARRARNLRPGIKLLFTTGYAGEIVPRGTAQVMDGEILAKPYRKDELARAIWNALKTPTYH